MESSNDSDSSTSTSWVFLDQVEDKQAIAPKNKDVLQQLPEQILESSKSEVDYESDEISVISECDDGNYEIVHEPEIVQNKENTEVAELKNKNFELKKLITTPNYLFAVGFVLFAVLGAFYYNENEVELLNDQSDFNCFLKNKALCDVNEIEKNQEKNYKKQNSADDNDHIGYKNKADAKENFRENSEKKSFLVDESYMNFRKKTKKAKEIFNEHVELNRKYTPKFQGDTSTNKIIKEAEFTRKHNQAQKLDHLTLEEKEKHLQLQEEYLKKKEKFLIRKEYQLIQKEIELERIMQKAKTNKNFQETKLKKPRNISREKQNETPNYNKNKIIIDKYRNRTVPGDWYNSLHEERGKLRRFKNAGDWYFDWATYRDKKRNKAHWYFKWMNEREHLRVKKIRNTHAF